MQNKKIMSKLTRHLSTVSPSNSAIMYFLGFDILPMKQLWFYYSIFMRHLLLQIIVSSASFDLLLLSKMVIVGEKSF